MHLKAIILTLLTYLLMAESSAQGIAIGDACTIFPPASFVPVADMHPDAAYSAIDREHRVYIVLITDAKTHRGYVSKVERQAKFMEIVEKLLSAQPDESRWPGHPQKIKYGRALYGEVRQAFRGDTLHYQLSLIETKSHFITLYVYTSYDDMRANAHLLHQLSYEMIVLKRE